MTTPTASGDAADPAPPDVPEIPLLTTPAGGIPEVVETAAGLDELARSLRSGSGPVAVDAERAHGFRYSQRAYLIQLRRADVGTYLLDPIAFSPTTPAGILQPADLSALGRDLADCEWIIHAASQDLRCLAEVGLVPRTLFDTELAGRLLGYPRVALGTLVEELFGVRLLKEHSASDWSARPLPSSWLAYAALDVELLIELRDRLAEQLESAGKAGWAAQEFAALAAGATAVPSERVDPWRRTSGLHRVRSRRGLAFAAALWWTRDEIARDLDRAPSKVLPDVAITELAAAERPDRATLRQIPMFSRRLARRYEPQWAAALAAVAELPDAELPPTHLPMDGPPAPRLWAAKDPAAAARLTSSRTALTALAQELNLPVENLLTPDHVRRLAWNPPPVIDPEAVSQALAEMGARPWQRDLTADLLAGTLAGPSAG